MKAKNLQNFDSLMTLLSSHKFYKDQLEQLENLKKIRDPFMIYRNRQITVSEDTQDTIINLLIKDTKKRIKELQDKLIEL